MKGFTKFSKKAVRKASRYAKKNPEKSVIIAGGAVGAAGIIGALIDRAAVNGRLKKARKNKQATPVTPAPEQNATEQTVDQDQQQQDNTAEQKEQQEAA